MSDSHALYQRTAEFAQSVLREIGDGDFYNPTPCDGWTVRTAINHLIGGQRYFMVAAQGHGTEAADEDSPDYTEGDLVAAHRKAAAACEAAFTDEVLGQTVATVRGDIPGRVLFGIASMENVIHAWDVGKGAMLDPKVPDDIAEVIFMIVSQAATAARGNGFKAEVTVPPNAPMTDRIMAMAGRPPDFSPLRM